MLLLLLLLLLRQWDLLVVVERPFLALRFFFFLLVHHQVVRSTYCSLVVRLIDRWFVSPSPSLPVQPLKDHLSYVLASK